MAGVPPEPDVAEAANQASYEAISGRCRASIEHTYSNEFKEATAVLDEALSLAQRRAEEYPEEPNLEAFVLIFHSFSSFMQGVSELQNNQRDALFARLSRVEELADKGPDWPGKPLMRAAGLSCVGAFLVISGTLLQKGQGAWKMVRALNQLRGGTAIQDASDYAGRERAFLRAIALYVHAQANLGVSRLPPVLLNAASWLMRFSGDRQEALQELETLWREDIMLSPSAATTLLGYYLDEFNVGIVLTDAQQALVRDMLKWVEERFSRSVLFAHHRALYQARQRNLEQAYTIGQEVVAVGETYPAMAVAAHMSMGKYAMAMLKWEVAADHYRRAQRVLKDVGRRAGGPECAFTAALCYAMAGDGAAASEMAAVAREYRKEDKKDWPDPDSEALSVSEAAPERIEGPADVAVDGKEQAWRPVRCVMSKLVFWWQCVSFMAPEVAERCLALMREYIGSCDDAESKLLMYAFLADAHRQLGSPAQVLEVCAEGLAAYGDVAGNGNSGGAVPVLHFLRAWACTEQSNVAGAKEALKRYEACGKNFYQYGFLSFRIADLQRRVGVEFKSKYTEMKVGARRTEEVVRRLPDGEDRPEEVSWECVVVDLNIGFSVLFQPEGGEWQELAREDKWEAADGALAGSFKPSGPGVLKLVFDNSFSWVRSKSVIYQVEPALAEG